MILYRVVLWTTSMIIALTMIPLSSKAKVINGVDDRRPPVSMEEYKQHKATVAVEFPKDCEIGVCGPTSASIVLFHDVALGSAHGFFNEKGEARNGKPDRWWEGYRIKVYDEVEDDWVYRPIVDGEVRTRFPYDVHKKHLDKAILKLRKPLVRDDGSAIVQPYAVMLNSTQTKKQVARSKSVMAAYQQVKLGRGGNDIGEDIKSEGQFLITDNIRVKQYLDKGNGGIVKIHGTTGKGSSGAGYIVLADGVSTVFAVHIGGAPGEECNRGALITIDDVKTIYELTEEPFPG